MNFKKIKQLIISVVLITVLITAAGCAAGSGDGISKSLEKLESLKNYEGEMNLMLDLTIQNQTEPMEFNSKITYFKEPMKLKLDSTSSFEGQDTITAAYVQKQDDKIVVVTDTMGEKQKQEYDAGDEYVKGLLRQDPVQQVNQILKASKDVKALDHKIVDGITCKVYQCTLSGEELSKIVLSNLDLLNTFNADNVDLSTLLKDIKDIYVQYYIDEATGYMYMAEMDITDVMGEFMQKLSSLFGAAGSIGVDNVLVKYKIYNMDQAADFTVPEA